MKQNNCAQFCKTKRSSISGVSIQKLSLCEAQFRPVPIWCKYPASPWPWCNCAIDKKKVLFFCKNLIWYWHLQMDSSFPDTYITLGLAVVFDYTCVELILEAPQHIASIPIITNYTLNCSCNTMLYTSTNAMFESCWSFQFSLESMPKMRWKNIKV